MADSERVVVAVDHARADDVRALLERHIAFARDVTHPDGVHALEPGGLVDPAIALFSARADGDLLGVAALRQLDVSHGEIKSMHTREAARRLSLETGTMAAFAPARALYDSFGFVPCAPFGAYEVTAVSVCMTLEVSPE